MSACSLAFRFPKSYSGLFPCAVRLVGPSLVTARCVDPLLVMGFGPSLGQHLESKATPLHCFPIRMMSGSK